jgi:DNA-binding transcriptional MerR regulator
MLIGELAERSGVSARMLRHYDSIGLLAPAERLHGGYREYSDADVQRLFHVEGLKSLGLSLNEIVAVLDDLSFSPSAMVAQLVARTRDRLAQEEELLRNLEQVQASGPEAWSDVLHTIGLVRGLSVGSPSARQRFVLTWPGADGQDARLLAEAALSEADPIVAGTMYWALQRLGDAAVPALAEGLRSPVTERRQRAAVALAKLNSPAAQAALAEAVRDPDPLVSGRAALTTGAGGDTEAIPTLVAMVVEGRDDVDAAAVLGSLASDPGCADAIADAIAAELDQVDVPTRQRLATALADLPGRRAEAVLTALTDDPDREVALTAAFVLRSRDNRSTTRHPRRGPSTPPASSRR